VSCVNQVFSVAFRKYLDHVASNNSIVKPIDCFLMTFSVIAPLLDECVSGIRPPRPQKYVHQVQNESQCE
jgi:hypothetical protein